MDKEDYKEPLKKNGPPRTIRPWRDDDEDTNYFMSEPSVSEAESSEYVRPAHIPSLLEPRADSPSSTSSKDLVEGGERSSPPPPQRQQGGGVAAYPTSPGTSLSSWDSPHLFRKQVKLYFSPEKSSALEASNNAATKNRRASNQSTSSSSSTHRLRQRSDQFLRDLKQYSVGAVKNARPEDFDSDRSNLNGADRHNVDAVIRNVRNNNNAHPAVPPVDTDQDETLVMDLSTDEEEDEVIKTTTDEPLDWEAKHSSADDEKTAERPRRARRGSGGGHRRAKSGDAASPPQKAKRGPGGHRRSRSGDAAAASLMTGGQNWKGMQFDRLPIPSEHDDEDEHEHSHDSEEIRKVTSTGNDSTPLSVDPNVAVETSGGFALGSGKNGRTSKRPRRSQRVRRLVPRAMNRLETNSTLEGEGMSRDVFSRHALESPRVIPKYVGRTSPTNESLSTIDHYTSERMESDSSGHGAGPRRRRNASDMDFYIPNRRHRTYSDADLFQPSLDHRVSDITVDSRGHGSTVSGWSNQHEPKLSTSWDPHYEAYRQRIEHYQLTDSPERPNGEHNYQFGDAPNETPDDTGSDYSQSDDSIKDDERNVRSNQLRYGPDVKQLDEFDRLYEDGEFRGKSQHVLRNKLSPFKTSGTVSSFGSRASYMPTSHSVGDYPTFVCPVCKTRQREFFTSSSAPSQFQGPAGYLALYFAIYVIAALFIFGLEEGWQALDCVYFAVITLTTAGLGDFVPTSDGAKILCSIFIYFGVACIGLLLGSYLASMLDEKSYKQAQKNRVENCSNCARLKNLQMLQMRKQRQKKSNHSQQSSLHAMRGVGFMSERNPHDLSSLGPHVLEREQKRAKSMPPINIQGSPSAVPNSSTTSSTRKTSNASSAAAASEKTEESPSEKESDNNASSYRKPLNVTSSPEATSVGNVSAGSPGMFGSPLTDQILGRQSHTRHMSLAGNDLDLSSERKFMRPRGYSADLSFRPPFAEAIPEDTPFEGQTPQSWSQHDGTEESESDEDYDDESMESETSATSDDTLDEARQRIKTAKYVFLTLKQALMNSILIILIGGLGFYSIEGLGAVDSFYFTTCLLTTVGYGMSVDVFSCVYLD